MSKFWENVFCFFRHCLLGDITEDKKHFERAWELSKKTYGKAQRKLGFFFFSVFKIEFYLFFLHVQVYGILKKNNLKNVYLILN